MDTAKLEMSCKQLEALYWQVKEEKDAFEMKLFAEQENIRFLQKKVEHLENSITKERVNIIQISILQYSTYNVFL